VQRVRVPQNPAKEPQEPQEPKVAQAEKKPKAEKPAPAADTTQQLNNFINTAKAFKLPEMLSQLKKYGIKFSDFHAGNIMKRKNGDYVINDLGRSAGGLAVNVPLAEKKEYLKKIILEVLRSR
jgi:hypothetical protein